MEIPLGTRSKRENHELRVIYTLTPKETKKLLAKEWKDGPKPNKKREEHETLECERCPQLI